MTKETLKSNEYHPAADSAKRYIASLGFEKIMQLQEAFASTTIEGNRLAEICSETLNRLTTGQPVSDRYLLGLAWTIKSMEDRNVEDIRSILDSYNVNNSREIAQAIVKRLEDGE